MKWISLIVAVFLLTACTRDVQVPQMLPEIELPTVEYHPPIMKAGDTKIIGVYGQFCTSEKMLKGDALIIFPKKLASQSRGRYIIVREKDYMKLDKNVAEWIKSAKQDHVVIKENNKKVKP